MSHSRRPQAFHCCLVPAQVVQVVWLVRLMGYQSLQGVCPKFFFFLRHDFGLSVLKVKGYWAVLSHVFFFFFFFFLTDGSGC